MQKLMNLIQVILFIWLNTLYTSWLIDISRDTVSWYFRGFFYPPPLFYVPPSISMGSQNIKLEYTPLKYSEPKVLQKEILNLTWHCNKTTLFWYIYVIFVPQKQV